MGQTVVVNKKDQKILAHYAKFLEGDEAIPGTSQIPSIEPSLAASAARVSNRSANSGAPLPQPPMTMSPRLQYQNAEIKENHHLKPGNYHVRVQTNQSIPVMKKNKRDNYTLDSTDIKVIAKSHIRCKTFNNFTGFKKEKQQP